MEPGNNAVDDKKTQLIDLGSKLKSLREAQGLAIEDISQKTKINKRYLTAIEEGRLEALPTGLYVRSFLRQYCEYLSAEDIWNIYDNLTKDQKITSDVIKARESKQNYSGAPKVFRPRSYLWLYFLVIISLGAAAWITWQYRGDLSSVATSPNDGGTAPITAAKEASVSGVAQVPAASGDAAPVAAKSADTAASVDLSWMDGGAVTDKTAMKNIDPAQQKPTAAGSKMLRIIPSGIVWVKVSQGTTVFFEGILKQGEVKEYDVGDNTPIRVRFGNPGKTAVQWQGKETAPVAGGSKPVTKYYWPDGRVTDKL